ncbi:glycosyltransferase [Mesorhizobium captivum]|uniref:glycosyltransferase n=1 Tax=Mesorhizobium captivum TaxID=3072319 RepID=UPI002A2437D9|nr:glycosyltransferase [Mesorhizobium sp. VK23E]MDX8512669.1 glycosyltransferase [Mesorhizobium sp. VK23E]
MRILLSTYGSRGDVEPVVALGAALHALGVEVRVSVPGDEEFAALCVRAGVPLAPAFAPVREWVKEMTRRRTSASPEGVAELISGQAAQIVARQYDTLMAAAEGCDAVVACGLLPSCAAVRLIAEQRGIRYILGTFCPIWLPSARNRPHEYPGHPLPAGVTDNRALWDHDIATKNALFGEAINSHRASLGLHPLDNVRDYVFGDEVLLACDPTLGPWLPSDLIDAAQTGAWILPDERPLPDGLEEFLDAGPPPVYVGFGSRKRSRPCGHRGDPRQGAAHGDRAWLGRARPDRRSRRLLRRRRGQPAGAVRPRGRRHAPWRRRHDRRRRAGRGAAGGGAADR